MRLEVARYRLLIIPETPLDCAYIEEVLGLKKDGQAIAVRRNAFGLNGMAEIEIKRVEVGGGPVDQQEEKP